MLAVSFALVALLAGLGLSLLPAAVPRDHAPVLVARRVHRQTVKGSTRRDYRLKADNATMTPGQAAQDVSNVI